MKPRHIDQHSEARKHKRFLKVRNSKQTRHADPIGIADDVPMSPGLDIDGPLPFASLWQSTDRTTSIEPQDQYQDWLESLANEVPSLGISLSPGVDEMPCDADEDFEPDDLGASHGIDISGLINLSSRGFLC